MAAGMAKRLRPLTDRMPKCLLKVGNRTLLERTIDAMAATGITEFVIVTGYRGEMIRDFLADHFQSFNFQYLHNADYEHNNNIYSLWLAGQAVRGQEFLLMDSDILCDPKAVAAVAQQQEPALALNRHELGEEEMKIVVDGNNRITAVGINASGETPELGGAAASQLAGAILAAQGADVEAVAGATVTSEAIINAAKECLDQASE